MKVLPLDLCSSLGPLAQQRFLCLPLGFLSSLLEGVNMGREGKKWVHIQGCTLTITVVFPSEGFFVVMLFFLCVCVRF